MIKSDNYISKSTIANARYGVFAGKDYKKGDIIEQNIFLIIFAPFKSCKISDYLFGHDNPNLSIVIFGNISIINHSEKSNCNPYNFDYEKALCTLYCTKDIKKNDELFINYGYCYDTWQ